MSQQSSSDKDSQNRKILALFKCGTSCAEIARMLSISPSMVRHRLNDVGIHPQKIMDKQRKSRYSLVWSLYLKKNTYMKIAEITGENLEFVRLAIRRHHRKYGFFKPKRRERKRGENPVSMWLGKITSKKTIAKICIMWETINPTEIAASIGLPVPAILAVAKEHNLYYGVE